VTALHSHMLTSNRVFFMHFWANDDAGKLARSLKTPWQVRLAKLSEADAVAGREHYSRRPTATPDPAPVLRHVIRVRKVSACS